MKKKLLFLAVCFAFYAMNNVATAQGAYLKLGDITGEATESGHDRWIDIVSFSQNMGVPDAASSGASRRRSAVEIQDIQFVKMLDKSSPKLMEHLLKGKVIPEAIIEMTKNIGGRTVTFYKITLNNVMVSNVNTSGDCSGSCQTSENFSLNFERIKVTYTEFGSNGAEKGKVETEYNKQTGR